MKRTRLQLLSLAATSLLAFYFVLSGCNKQLNYNSTDKSIQTILKDSIGAQLSGNVQLRGTANNEVLISLTTSDADTVRNLLVLGVDKRTPIALKNLDLGSATIYFYKDNRAVLLHSLKTDNIYFLGVIGNDSYQRVAAMEKDKSLSNRLVSMIYGFGLTSAQGKWDQNVLMNADKKFAANLIALADLTGRTTPAQRAIAIEDAIYVTCKTGGTGATSCSISEPIPPQSCSVTCATGYFACCNTNSVTCNCVLNGTPVSNVVYEYGQCGGQGYTGPETCVQGTSCVYVNPYYSQCE